MMRKSFLKPEKSLEELAGTLSAEYKRCKESGNDKQGWKILKKMSRILLLNTQDKSLLQLVNEEIFNFENFDEIGKLLNHHASLFSQKTRQRLLFYADSWIRGGIQRVMKMVAEYLAKDYEVIIVSTDLEVGGAYVLDDMVLHIKISKSYQERIAQRLAALCMFLDADLFIGCANYLPSFLDIYGILKDLGIKSISWEHNYYFFPCRIPWTYPVFQNRIEAYGKADVSAWLTKFTTNIYSLMNNNGAYMPNPNFFNGVYHFGDKRDEKGEKTILMVGRFYDSIKRLDKALIVFKEVLLSHPDARIVIVGGYDLGVELIDSPGITIADLIKSLKIPEKNILFAGEQEVVEDFYNKASLFLMTSDSEGFPMVINEAGSFRLPSVMFEIPGIEEIVLDGKNGFVIKKNDYRTMAKKICLLLSDSSLRRRMGNKAFELTDRFDKQKICKRWSDLIGEVVNSKDRKKLQKILGAKYKPELKINKDFVEKLVSEYEDSIKMVMKKSNSENVFSILEMRKSVLDGIHFDQLVKYLLARMCLRIRNLIGF